MVNADQIFNPDFLTKLSGAADRYYDMGEGSFKEGYEHFHNAAGQATLVKAAAKEAGLKSVTYGTYELPSGTTHPEGPGAGYDWELVDNRWLVDLWRISYHGSGPVVYDLHDPEELRLAEDTFGHNEGWIVNSGIDPVEIAKADEIWKHFIIPQRAVDDLLGGLTER